MLSCANLPTQSWFQNRVINKSIGGLHLIRHLEHLLNNLELVLPFFFRKNVKGLNKYHYRYYFIYFIQLDFLTQESKFYKEFHKSLTSQRVNFFYILEVPVLY